MNSTIPVPSGYTDHGQPGLICVPSTWTSILTFFATNYLAHAATTLVKPGQSKLESAATIAGALFIPGFGAMRILRYLDSRPKFIKDELQRAAAAGALCMVIRKERCIKNDPWRRKKDVDKNMGVIERGEYEMHQQRPNDANDDTGAGDTVPSTSEEPRGDAREEIDDWYNRMFDGPGRMIPLSRTFHGRLNLPDNDAYVVIECPPNTPFKAYGATAVEGEGVPDMKTFHLGVDYSIPKMLLGLLQVIWGSMTLYKARGDQLDLYGYAAFGLSVTPYVMMSIANIAANFFMPQYPAMFLVHTPDMDEARKDQGEFVGVLAAVDTEAPLEAGEKIDAQPHVCTLLKLFLAIFFTVTPFFVVGALSMFQPGSISSTGDRAWLMSWLAIGSLSLFGQAWMDIALGLGPALGVTNSDYDRFTILQRVIVTFCASIYFIPATGGMVTVGRMLQSYGICTKYE